MVCPVELPTLISLFGSSLLGGGGAWGVAFGAARIGLIDSPGERSSHRVPTPRGGGIGILGAACFSAVILGLRSPLWVPAVLIGMASFCDDYRGLSPLFRLFLQFFLVSFVVPALISPGNGFVLCMLLGFGGMIYIVGTANLFNFMDGVNGMAGISGAVGFALVSLFGWLQGGGTVLVLYSLAISFACLGFLPFNFPRAKVFLGDVGSVFLGFQFAVLVLVFSQSVWDFITLTGVLAPTYFDTIITLLRRWKNRENLFQAHRQHLYQTLVHARGWRHWQVSLLYGLMQFGIGMIVLLAWHFGELRLGGIFLALAAVIFAKGALRVFQMQLTSQ